MTHPLPSLRATLSTPNRPTAEPWLIAVAAAALSLLYATEIATWDIWWHLATGRWMTTHLAVPAVDPFSFTAKGEPWINVNWLGALTYYAAWHLGGPAGVVVLKILIAFGILLFLGLSLRELGVSAPLTVAGLICFAVLLQPRFTFARPFALGGALCAAAMYIGTRASLRADRSVFLLVPLIGIWMNVHSSAVLGIPILGLVSAVLLLSPTDRSARRNALLSFAAVALFFLLFERGHGILRQAVAYDPDSLIVKYTVEWRALRFREPLVWVPWTLFAGAFLFGIFRVRRYPFPFGLLLLGIALGTRFSRHLYVGVLLSAPLVTLLFEELAGYVRARGWQMARRAVPAVMVLAVVGLHMAVERAAALRTDFGFTVASFLYPEDTLAYLKTLPEGRTVHNYHLGGYLMFHGIPGGVFMDGRSAQVYTERHFETLFKPIMDGPEGLKSVVDKYGIVYGLGDLRQRFHEYFMRSTDWVPVYFGDTTTLFVRASAAARLSAAGRDLFPTIRYWKDERLLDNYYKPLLADEDDRQRFEDEFVRAAAQNSDSRTLVMLLAFIYDRDKETGDRITARLPESDEGA